MSPGREAAGGQGSRLTGAGLLRDVGSGEGGQWLDFGEVLLWSDGEDQISGEVGDGAILV